MAIVDSLATAAGAILESLAADGARAREAGDPPRPSIGSRQSSRSAARIQRSFVPLIPPDIPGYEVASHYEAAREVGRRLLRRLPDSAPEPALAICIADVTGKGIAAALLMAFARPILHAAIDHAGARRGPRADEPDPRRGAALGAVHHRAVRHVEMRAGILRLANAGHEPPLLVRPADDGPIWLEASGPLLGAFDGSI